MCHLVVISRCITYIILGTVTNYRTVMKLSKDLSTMRIDLFGQLTDIPGLDITNLESNALCELLLLGSSQLNIMGNRIILEATIAFIDKTNRFD